MSRVLLRKSTNPMWRTPLLVMLGLVLLSTVAFSQETATDPSGAAVPGAKVLITNTDTGLVRTTTTNATGNYSARELAIGHYTVRVEVAGFKSYQQTGITLNVNDSV